MRALPLSCLFASGILWMAGAGGSSALETQPASAAAELNPAAVTPLERLAVTRERPLFNASRHRPAEAPVTEAPPPAPPAGPPQLSLSGVIVDANGPRAMLRTDPASKPLSVRMGDEVAGWRVTSIEGQRLVISLDDRSVTVGLFGGDHGTVQIPVAHASDRVFEVNAAGVLRSHRIHRAH